MKLPASGQADLNCLSILLHRKFTIHIPGIAHFFMQRYEEAGLYTTACSTANFVRTM